MATKTNREILNDGIPPPPTLDPVTGVLTQSDETKAWANALGAIYGTTEDIQTGLGDVLARLITVTSTTVTSNTFTTVESGLLHQVDVTAAGAAGGTYSLNVVTTPPDSIKVCKATQNSDGTWTVDFASGDSVTDVTYSILAVPPGLQTVLSDDSDPPIEA